MNKTLLFILILFYSCTSNQKVDDRIDDTQLKSDLPEIVLTLQDGKQRKATSLKGNVLLVLFQPDCEHCQREAERIRARLDDFKDYQMYFISSAPIDEVIQFARQHNLANDSRIHLATASVYEILTSYGPIEAPSIYAYSEGKLIKAFHGEVEVAEILKYLN
jgi:peroxiredoxin